MKSKGISNRGGTQRGNHPNNLFFKNTQSPKEAKPQAVPHPQNKKTHKLSTWWLKLGR
jgi:hypothetical protein